ncbi:YhdT family protein [Cytobacillus praedii]|uniref:YhdT family protein n=1 Tax=Cytobacillus praedii TaxID=1742358 RepID=UPI002E1D987B|nr:YhdT family protein [Cytobacillus praedii]
MKDQVDFIEDSRFAQCDKEMRVTMWLFVINILLVGGVSLWIGLNKPAASMNYILGFPAWFFWGGLVANVIFCILPYFMVKFFYKDMSIEAEDEG